MTQVRTLGFTTFFFVNFGLHVVTHMGDHALVGRTWGTMRWWGTHVGPCASGAMQWWGPHVGPCAGGVMRWWDPDPQLHVAVCGTISLLFFKLLCDDNVVVL
jgi:hypothetical protein